MSCQSIENVFAPFYMIPVFALIARNCTLVTGTYWLHTMYLDANSPHPWYFVILMFATHSQEPHRVTIVTIVTLHAA